MVSKFAVPLNLIIKEINKMGKKDGMKRKRDPMQEDYDDVEVDPELEAEMAALKAIREEKENPAQLGEKPKTGYNTEGLIKCLEKLDTTHLPFKETYQLCDFDINIRDENDDLDREVINCSLSFCWFQEFYLPIRVLDNID